MIESMSELKDVPGYEGLYSVTKDGKVWSCELDRFLKPTIRSNRYYCVGLYKDRIYKNYLVHRLILATWGDLDLDDTKLVVHHINEDPSDNRIDNLRIMSDYKHRCSHKKGYGKNTETHKVCTKCGKLKRRNEFNVARRKLDGLGSWCRLCDSERGQKYYQMKREEYDLRLSVKKP